MLDIEIEKISRTRGFTKGGLHLVGITYLVSCKNTQNITLSDEHTKYFWKKKEEILEGIFPNGLKDEVLAV